MTVVSQPDPVLESVYELYMALCARRPETRDFFDKAARSLVEEIEARAGEDPIKREFYAYQAKVALWEVEAKQWMALTGQRRPRGSMLYSLAFEYAQVLQPRQIRPLVLSATERTQVVRGRKWLRAKTDLASLARPCSWFTASETCDLLWKTSDNGSPRSTVAYSLAASVHARRTNVFNMHHLQRFRRSARQRIQVATTVLHEELHTATFTRALPNTTPPAVSSLFPFHVHEACVSVTEALVTAHLIGCPDEAPVKDCIRALTELHGGTSRAVRMLTHGRGLAPADAPMASLISPITFLSVGVIRGGDEFTDYVVDMLNEKAPKKLAAEQWARVFQVQ